MIMRLLLLLCLFAFPTTVGAQQQTIPSVTILSLSEATLQDMLDREDGSDYQLECLTVLPPNIVVPMGTLDMTPEIVGKIRYGSPVSVRVSININGLQQMNIMTVWRVRKYAEVLVATRDITSYTTLTEADVIFAKREITRLDQVIFDIDKAVGLEVKRPITYGSVISPSMLTRPQLIKSGDNVIIVSMSGSVMVKVPGQALQGGAVGDVIRVRNVNSGKSVLARIENENTVIITSSL